MKKGYPFLIIFFAVSLVAILSFVPWHDITGGVIKDFDLFADLKPDSLKTAQGDGNEFVDPTLIEDLQNMADTMTTAVLPNNNDSISRTESSRAIVLENKANRVDGQVVIEDYTSRQAGLANLKKALSQNKARIAVIGDSYIEGDILTQDLRSQLQNIYGGRGVGYVPAHSKVAGFRRTVNIKDSGWTEYDVQKASSKPYFNIAGEYFSASSKAFVQYKGQSKDSRLASWSQSSVMFIAPVDGNLIMTTDSTSHEFTVIGNKQPQFLTINEETSSFRFESQIPGLIFLGAWLHDPSGVILDCMSNRGDSGASHRKINSELSAEMRKNVNYDLIIMEYGINALTSDQYNYNGYGNLMRQVIERLQECYPNADILMLGIGDRGQKIDGEVHSLPTASAMVEAQRKAAREAGALFFDMREAMGGQDAVVDWRNRHLINGDYIHLNSAGGKELATLIINAIQYNLKNEQKGE